MGRQYCQEGVLRRDSIASCTLVQCTVLYQARLGFISAMRFEETHLDIKSHISADLWRSWFSERQQLIMHMFIWFFSAIGAVASSKMTMILLAGRPAFLCFSQNLTACVCAWIWAGVQQCPHTDAVPSRNPQTAPEYRVLVAKIGVAYGLGFLFTNYSIDMMTASLAETVKSAEPILSVGLAGCLLQEGWPSSKRLLGVLLAVCGVVIASSQRGSGANALGVIAANFSS